MGCDFFKMKLLNLLLVGFLLLSGLLMPGSVIADLHPEERLLDAIQQMQQSNFDDAESKLKSLVSDIPDFKLAQLVYADVLTSRAASLNSLASGLDDSLQKKLLFSEIKNRYHALNEATLQSKVPVVLAKLDPFYRHAIVVDLSKSRLYLFDSSQGVPVLIDDFFVSMGRSGAGKNTEGDLKTPLGVYFVQSYIAPTSLADKYGAGAYPINYPNAWDRLSGKTGHGIWLHGTRSGTYNRPTLASEGCVVLPNEDLLNLGRFIDLKSTPVLIGENIQWLTTEQWQQHKTRVATLHDKWRLDWESMDVNNYLSHYSLRFTNGEKDFSHWSEHKRRIAKHKTFVNVALSNVSLLVHPNEEVMVATFLQTYASDNFSSTSWKRQYWNKESDGQWRIVFEDKISSPVMPALIMSDTNN